MAILVPFPRPAPPRPSAAEPEGPARWPAWAGRALAALGLLVALRVAFWLLAPPNSDEAYYWLWGRHPALSYFDHPPLPAWIQGAVHAVLGRSLLALRLSAALTTIGSVALAIRLSARVAGGRSRAVALAAAVAFLGSPLLAMMAAFAWNDHLLLFFVLLAADLLSGFLAQVAAGGRGSTTRLLAGAAALALAGLCKYNAVFLAAAAGAAILVDRRLRPLVRDARLWVAAAVCLAVLSPVLVWNARHGLASFRYNLVDRNASAAALEIRPVRVLRFLVPGMLLLGPFLAWAAAAGARAASGAAGDAFRRLALLALATSTGAFTALAALSGALYYWNVVGYVLLVPIAAPVLASRPRLLAAHGAFGLALAAAMTAHGTLGPLNALIGARDDDSDEMWGWRNVAMTVREARGAGGVGFVAATDYRSGAHLAWALGDPDVAVLSSHRSQFDLWFDPGAHRGESALLLSDRRAPLATPLRARFRAVHPVAAVPVVRLGRHLEDYQLWRAEGYDGLPLTTPPR